MAEAGLDRHQLAGLDSKERGFNRPVELERVGEGYRAILRYESLRVATEPCATQDEALSRLIHALQVEGYRQLRTQRSFRNGVYLGSRSPGSNILIHCRFKKSRLHGLSSCWNGFVLKSPMSDR